MFRIDNELLINSPKRKDILAILAVIYENLSRQGRLINRYNITNELKRPCFKIINLSNNFSHRKFLIKRLLTLWQRAKLLSGRFQQIQNPRNLV